LKTPAKCDILQDNQRNPFDLLIGGIRMIPFILSQKSATAIGPLTDEELATLKVHDDRAIDFFRERGIAVPDVMDKATWSQTAVSKSTQTPPGGPVYNDSDVDKYNEPDHQMDPD
jgi:hypothetical protein